MAVEISTAVRYGARAMAHLASADPDRVTSVREVCQQQQISVKYMERILQTLKTAGLVEAVRGRQGGYVLAKPADCITLLDLYKSLEGSLTLTDCVDNPDLCPMHEVCPTRDTWVEVKEAIHHVLKRTTIQELAERRERRNAPPSLMYHI
jgi:Rrf2 family transcriptional regulator, cysteine metabolism repressor